MIWKNYSTDCLNFFHVLIHVGIMLYLDIERCHSGGVPVNLNYQQKKYTHQFDVCIKKSPNSLLVVTCERGAMKLLLLNLLLYQFIIISLYLYTLNRAVACCFS